jgi:hypothetical protein
MIGGGGSTANRAAADVIGGGATGAAAAGSGAAAGADIGRASTGLLGAAAACACVDPIGAPPLGDIGAIDDIGLEAIDGAGAPAAVSDDSIAPLATSFGPRKSLTRVSTSWLIEMWFVSQNAFSRSYVVRLTLMLRRVCFLAMFNSLRYG